MTEPGNGSAISGWSVSDGPSRSESPTPGAPGVAASQSSFCMIEQIAYRMPPATAVPVPALSTTTTITPTSRRAPMYSAAVWPRSARIVA